MCDVMWCLRGGGSVSMSAVTISISIISISSGSSSNQRPLLLHTAQLCKVVAPWLITASVHIVPHRTWTNQSRSNFFYFIVDVSATYSVAFVEMTSGSDFLRKMSLLRRKVRRRDVTRYMSPHLCSSCVLEYPACEFNVGQSTDKFIQTVPLQFTITTLTANRLARVSQFFHCSSLFICGRGEAPGSSREALPPSAPPHGVAPASKGSRSV